MSELKKTVEIMAELLQTHDKKLSLDYQSIQKLEKDTDKLVGGVDTLKDTVHEMSGVVKTQSNIINAILAITVVSFLGFVVKNAYESNIRMADPKEVAEAFVVIMQEEMAQQQNIALQVDQAHKRAKNAAKKEKGCATKPAP